MANRCSNPQPPEMSPQPLKKGDSPLFSRKKGTACLFVLLGAALAAQTPDRGQTEALARRAAERLTALQREAESLARQERGVLAELRKLEVDRAIKVEELAAIQRDMRAAQDRLAATTAQARRLEGEAERQRPDVEARMVQLYKMGRAGYWRLLLDVNNLREVGRAYRTAAALERIDRDRVEEHRRTLAALATERASLQTRVKELGTLQRRAQDANAAVERAVAARADLVTSIDERRDLNAQLAGELQEAQQKIQATLTAAAAGRPASAPDLPLRPFQGALPWPADGVVSARFGRQPANSPGAPVRNGIELSLPEGQSVAAVHGGVVAYADLFSGYANLVIVEHGDGNYSLYGHLAAPAVKKGDRVEAGTVVGTAGRNPAGNPSVYFELRVDGRPVDPLQWLKR